MQFKIVGLGIVLLFIGLGTYASVPAIHRTSVLNEEKVWVQNGFPIASRSLVERPTNVTVFPGTINHLRGNVTLLQSTSDVSSLRLELFGGNMSQACPPSQRSIALVDEIFKDLRVSFNATLKSTGTYCFVFDNQGSPNSRTIDISALLSSTTENLSEARDGTANTAGLGLGALGLVVALYGFSRKTIIPWE